MTRAEAVAYRSKIESAATAMSDESALAAVELFPEWVAGRSYAVGDRARYDSSLYKCIQAHTALADWMPTAAPALWTAVSVEEYPAWVQPSGAHDAYSIGDKVTYNGRHYVCTVDGNVYAPDIYGWEPVENS